MGFMTLKGEQMCRLFRSIIIGIGSVIFWLSSSIRLRACRFALKKIETDLDEVAYGSTIDRKQREAMRLVPHDHDLRELYEEYKENLEEWTTNLLGDFTRDDLARMNQLIERLDWELREHCTHKEQIK